MSRDYARYLVMGTRAYRGHDPGEVFEASIDPAAEARAIERGNIRVLERIEPMLDGDFQLPQDWPPSEADAPANHEAPKGASFVGEGG